MQAVKRVAGLLLNVTFFAATFAAHAEGAVPSVPDYAYERAARAQGLTQPYGWFSLVALEWLKPGVTTVGSAKDNSVVLAGAPAHLMELEQKDGKVTLLASDSSLALGGQPLHADKDHPMLSDREDNASAMASGTLRLWAIDRGGKRYLRVKDSDAPALKHFHGLRWYAADRHYRVEARWIPYSSPHTMRVMNKLGQITPVPVPGYVEVELDGKKQTLVPMEAGKNGLWFVFRDATARSTTDGGGRFLTTDAPSNGVDKPGTVTLDFNEAVNPPCAYSPYATCPLAAPENRLLVPVTAGEKRYDD
jgi:uncharacterized protein (DUF1684 family)